MEGVRMENMPLKEHSPARNSDLLPVARANVEWMGGVLEHYPIESSARELVAITCLYGALRHFNGICVLVEADAFASAFALLRVEWQALLNGAWLFAACPEHLLQDYALGAREFPKIPRLIKEVESKLEHQIGKSRVLTDTQVRIGKFMHNHTHAGHHQIYRLIDKGLVAETGSPRELDGLLFISLRMALMALALLALVAKDEDLAHQVDSRLEELRVHVDRIVGSW
jgi:hypothetical protein